MSFTTKDVVADSPAAKAAGSEPKTIAVTAHNIAKNLILFMVPPPVYQSQFYPNVTGFKNYCLIMNHAKLFFQSLSSVTDYRD